MIYRFIALLLTLFCLQGKAFSYRIVTSIGPLGGLAAYLLEGIAEPQVLLDGSLSPHTYTLRPADIQQLKEADIIIWLGPSYEGFLSKAIKSSSQPVLTLLETPGLELLPVRSKHAHDHGDHHPTEVEEQSHSHGEDKDPHVWLDPRLCQKLLKAMHGGLVQTFPNEKEKLDQNLIASLKEMEQLYRSLQQKFTLLHNKPFMVYHDAYQYLERAFGLKNVGTIVSQPEIPMTLQDRRQFFHLVEMYPGLCVLLEPQFSLKVLENLKGDLTLPMAILDPLGVGLRGKSAYSKLMNNIEISMRRCLTP